MILFVSTSSPRSTVQSFAHEGLPDAVVADIEVHRDRGEGLAIPVESSGFTDLLVAEGLTAKLHALNAKQVQQAAL